MKEKIDIKSLDLDELQRFVESMGEKKFRAKQIYEWMHQKLVTDFSEMTNLSKNIREKLNQSCELTALETVDVKISKLDGTRKYFGWECHRKCSDEVQAWQFRMHIIPGGVQDGMPFLRLYPGRSGAKSGAV